MKFVSMFFLFALQTVAYSQIGQFTNYEEKEKKLVVIDFGYQLDSVNTETIPREGNEKMYQFIEEELAKIAPSINREIDGPYKMFFDIKAGADYADCIRKIPEVSRNQPSGLYGIASDWHNAFYFLGKDKLDFSKTLFVEYGPDKAYYDGLIRDPHPMDYAMETTFKHQEENEDSNRIYGNYADAVSPTFPGGIPALNKFLYEEIIAPLKNMTRSGRTLIFFLTIEADGSISNIKPTWNKGTEESDFALEVLQTKMPQWKPAFRYGKKVRSSYALRIKIKHFYSQEMIDEILNVE